LKLNFLLFSILFFGFCTIAAQNVSLYNQFSGRYDFTFVGNTLNVQENGANDPCDILTSSAADLNLNSEDTIESAYLYWAGSGTGDFNVQLNSNQITAERTFALIQASSGNPFFAAFANVTSIVQGQGNGTYTLSELDVSSFLNPSTYCNNGTNFAGWAIVVVYKNNNLPINQVNIYDGLQNVPTSLTITLNSLNVVDNNNAKIGFIAWEGDRNIQVNETLSINGNVLSNPPLNPANNAFNGTNSVTGSDQLYNMDLDIYNIQNNINVGDTSAIIQLTSGQDFVMINTIITKLNNQLPDATITIDNIQQECNSRLITVDYTIFNSNATDILASQTPIAIYANGILIGTAQTINTIPIGGSESGTINLFIPSTIPLNFNLKFVVDDIGNGTGIVNELIENNNSFTLPVSLWISPTFNIVPNIYNCVSNIANTTVDFSNYVSLVATNVTDEIQFFTSNSDAVNNINPITNTANYTVSNAITTIYIRLDNQYCYNITSFTINLVLPPLFNPLANLSICRENENSSFNFFNYATSVLVNPTDIVQFFENELDANANINPILNFTNYIPNSTPATIFIRIENEHCFSVTSFNLDYFELPTFNTLPNLISCNEGLTQGTFNFFNYTDLVKTNPNDAVFFYESLNDAINSVNEIINTYNYTAITTPKEIFVRIENDNCYAITSFMLITRNCPPVVYNYVSANNDGLNDVFYIKGLRDIFVNFEIYIYNRWGKLVWTGNNNTADWDGFSNEGFRFDKNNSPKGTYFYIIYLNDPDYLTPLQGYLYFTK
jgi:gliding motility-associated-like protein